jgi:hypothetical protein
MASKMYQRVASRFGEVDGQLCFGRCRARSNWEPQPVKGAINRIVSSPAILRALLAPSRHPFLACRCQEKQTSA